MNIKIEPIQREKNKPQQWGVVDYLTGEPHVQFKGTKQECLAFWVGIVSPSQLPLA